MLGAGTGGCQVRRGMGCDNVQRSPDHHDLVIVRTRPAGPQCRAGREHSIQCRQTILEQLQRVRRARRNQFRNQRTMRAEGGQDRLTRKRTDILAVQEAREGAAQLCRTQADIPIGISHRQRQRRLRDRQRSRFVADRVVRSDRVRRNQAHRPRIPVGRTGDDDRGTCQTGHVIAVDQPLIGQAKVRDPIQAGNRITVRHDRQWCRGDPQRRRVGRNLIVRIRCRDAEIVGSHIARRRSRRQYGRSLQRGCGIAPNQTTDGVSQGRQRTTVDHGLFIGRDRQRSLRNRELPRYRHHRVVRVTQAARRDAVGPDQG